MLFKLIWNLLKQLRWIIPLGLVAVVAYGFFVQYQTLKNSPVGAFLPQQPVNIDLGQIFHTTESPTPSQTPTATPFPDSMKLTITTKNGPVIYTTEIATTPEKRDLGLMYRSNLAPYRGMYFIFEYPVQYGFWMRNCEISLDMIFIDENKKIVDIKENVPPCKTIDPSQNNCPAYVPKAKYLTVLEIAGGSAKANSIEIGNSLSY